MKQRVFGKIELEATRKRYRILEEEEMRKLGLKKIYHTIAVPLDM